MANCGLSSLDSLVAKLAEDEARSQRTCCALASSQRTVTSFSIQTASNGGVGDSIPASPPPAHSIPTSAPQSAHSIPPSAEVCIMGSGNWGSAVAKIVGENVQKQSSIFSKRVTMWVFDEQVADPVTNEQRSLVDVINERHENVKYLPGIKLPENVTAERDARVAAKQADIFVWVLPHQFVPRTVDGLKDVVEPTAISVSLIKGGLELKNNRLGLCSNTLRDLLGHDVSVLMGANVANEVAEGQFCEATLGYTKGSESIAICLRNLLHGDYFYVNIIEDVPGVELCGGLKNVVALGAGFCDGLGLGGNTKAAIIRIGLHEMKHFIRYFFPDARDETFLESCGIADLFTTCIGGRNRKCAEAFACARGVRPWTDIEAEMLNGQKLQGTLTAEEIWPVIMSNHLCEQLPLLTRICQIALHGHDVATLTSFVENSKASDIDARDRALGA